jgi:prolyl oligopeptidase
MRIPLWSALVVSLSLSGWAAPPASRTEAVTDTYHNVSVEDDYRWLEDGASDEVRKWSDDQNAHAREFLDKLHGVEAIRKRVAEIMTADMISYSSLVVRGSTTFAIKVQPPKEQPLLVVIDDLESPGSERVLFDPNAADSKGSISINWFEPSPDGKTVAVCLSTGGTELGDAHFYETATGKEVYEVIPKVNSGTAGGDLAWSADGSGVYYSKHVPVGGGADEGHLRHQGAFHTLGTPVDQDRYELGKDFLPVAELEFDVDDRTGRVLATVQKGDGGEFLHFIRSEGGTWTQFADYSDQVVDAVFGKNDDLLLISRKDAPRGKILRLPLADPQISSATTLVPEGADTITSGFYRQPPTLLATDSRMYVVYQLGGPTELRVFDHQGKQLEGPEILPVSEVDGLTAIGGDDVLFSNTSYLDPPAVYRFDAASGRTEKTWMAAKAPVDLSGVKVVREFATSKDGTKVPLNIMIPPGTELDGTNPTLATGYGGYGASNTPSFSATRDILFSHGFIVAVANIRGGSEYGEPWHKQGNLTNKQNVFDDFAACLQHLVDRRYTSPERLAIQGGSNGGLLMGALLTQHPALVKAVVSHVGIYDMLRVELSPNGVFNIAEFGTVKDPDQFEALYAYSPYHHVKDGTQYPSVLFLTGANDPRVDPMQSRKMTARLQAAGTENPVLLRTSADSGHGLDTALSERIGQAADVFAFLFDRLGVAFENR